MKDGADGGTGGSASFDNTFNVRFWTTVCYYFKSNFSSGKIHKLFKFLVPSTTRQTNIVIVKENAFEI